MLWKGDVGQLVLQDRFTSLEIHDRLDTLKQSAKSMATLCTALTKRFDLVLEEYQSRH